MTNEELQKNITYRIAEIDAYQVNIDNYSAMIQMLPNECPTHLEPYKNSSPAELTNVLPFEDIQIISDLQYRKRLESLLVTERLEQRKVKLVLDALNLRNV